MGIDLINGEDCFAEKEIEESITANLNAFLLFIEDTKWLFSKKRTGFVVAQIKLTLPNTKLLVLHKNAENNQDLIEKLPKQARLFPTLTDYYSSFFKF